jgi:hypothetical protein
VAVGLADFVEAVGRSGSFTTSDESCDEVVVWFPRSRRKGGSISSRRLPEGYEDHAQGGEGYPHNLESNHPFVQ